MSIRKRGDSPFWWYDFTVAGTRYRGSTEVADKAEAKKIEAKLRTEAVTGQHFHATTDLTIDQACGKYYLEHGQYASSTAIMRTYLRRLPAMLGRAKMVSAISDADVSAYVGARRAAGAGASSINRELNQLRAVLKRAERAWSVPCRAINWSTHRLTEPAQRRRYASAEEERLILEHAAPHLRDVIRFALLTGLRRANILGLKWSQIDRAEGLMHFMQKSRKTGGEHHTLAVTAEIGAILDAHKGEHPEHVFSFRGKPIRDIKSGWATACKKAGVIGLHVHDCRHTAATRILKKTKNLALAKAVLGHADLKTTLRYAHVLMDDVREGMEALS